MIIRQTQSEVIPERGRVNVSSRNQEFKTILSDAESVGNTEQARVGAVSTGTGPGGSDVRPLQSLGVIDRNSPTVSNLLIKNPQLKKDCWNIIYSKINADKPYTKIPPGTEIFIDTSTSEIVWRSGKSGIQSLSGIKETPEAPEIASAVPLKEKGDGLGAKLVDGVRSFMGTGYDEVDCYELVVKGLEKAGFKYHGPGGLSEHLINMATDNGKPLNRFLTGEGLIKASGTNLYSKRVKGLEDSDKVVSGLMSEMKPVLDKGDILSFSTQTRGHTGVVSEQNGIWTYINSGQIDHDIFEADKKMKGVGEEMLSAELLNWVNRAAERNEELEITLGRLSEDKLSGFKKVDVPPAGLLGSL